jgi:hypothetical protein
MEMTGDRDRSPSGTTMRRPSQADTVSFDQRRDREVPIAITCEG